MQVIDSVKQTHPQLPIILYISGSGGLLERMAAANPDIISIDQSVDIVDGIKRVGSGFAIQVSILPTALLSKIALLNLLWYSTQVRYAWFCTMVIAVVVLSTGALGVEVSWR
jgi:uroporphyrinogen decarboxylase